MFGFLPPAWQAVFTRATVIIGGSRLGGSAGSPGWVIPADRQLMRRECPGSPGPAARLAAEVGENGKHAPVIVV